MVEVTYHCPYCGAVTGVERGGYLNDRCVTRDPLDGWAYAPAADGVADDDFTDRADGIEVVCLGDGAPDSADASDATTGEGGADDPVPEADGCGRTYYVSFVRYEDGRPVEPDVPLEDYPDRPRFDFQP